MLRKLNNEKVEVPALIGCGESRPVKGGALFPELYSNIFLCAKKRSGKTSVIYTMLKRCCGKDTKVIAFVSTLHKDNSWLAIQDMLKKQHIYFEGYTSLFDDKGQDILDTFMKGEELPPENDDKAVAIGLSIKDNNDKNEEATQERKSKYVAPEFIIIIDDLSNELHTPSVTALLKKNRHLRCRVVLSSQWLNDLVPAARKQCDYVLLFGGHSVPKLEEIYRDVDISVPFETFVQYYQKATHTQFSFLYIDVRGDKFRINFSVQIADR